MTLRGQLFSGISAILLLIFIGLFFLSGQASRSYLEQQLASHASDNATALALRISPALAKKDMPLVEIVVSSIFDRGYFQRIAIVSEHGETLITKELPIVVEGVPQWFSNLMQLEIHPGEALLTSGWKQFGKVVVISQPTLAYQHLWRNAQETFYWLFAAMLASIGLMYLFLRVILKPLRNIEMAAKAMCERRFEQIATMPAAKELRQVVNAMNDASHRVSKMLDAEVEKAERYRREAYFDEVTKLENRRSFDLRAAEAFNGALKFSDGLLLMFELDGFKEFNTEHGYPEGNKLLSRIAQQAVEQLGPSCSIMARISGAGFAFIYLDGDHDKLNLLISKFRADVLDKTVPVSMSYAIGGAEFASGETRPVVFDRADIALEKARQQGPRQYEQISMSNRVATPVGCKAWHELLEDTLANNRLKLLAQPVVSLADGKILNHELTGVLLDAKGETLPAGMFIPMAQRYNFMVRIDMAIIEMILAQMNTLQTKGINEIGINLSLQSMEDVPFQKWLQDRLTAIGREACSRLSFDLAELAYGRNARPIEALRELTASCGAKICIDNFGLNANSLDLMRRVIPNYAKLSRGLVNELLANQDTQRLVDSIVQVGKSLDITVIALGVENEAEMAAVRAAGVQAAQGYHLGKPGPI
jgi:diguanylate cyclase (GGDEF)-like protein